MLKKYIVIFFVLIQFSYLYAVVDKVEQNQNKPTLSNTDQRQDQQNNLNNNNILKVLNTKSNITNQNKKILFPYFNIPVFLQVTRSKFGNHDGNAAIQTESFKEIWILEISPNGKTFLKSPRDSVEVFGINHYLMNGNLPQRIVLTTKDFVRLVGYKNLNISEEALGSIVEQNKYLTINILKSHENMADEFTINLSENEHVEIHLEMNKG